MHGRSWLPARQRVVGVAGNSQAGGFDEDEACCITDETAESQFLLSEAQRDELHRYASWSSPKATHLLFVRSHGLHATAKSWMLRARSCWRSSWTQSHLCLAHLGAALSVFLTWIVKGIIYLESSVWTSRVNHCGQCMRIRPRNKRGSDPGDTYSDCKVVFQSLFSSIYHAKRALYLCVACALMALLLYNDAFILRLLFGISPLPPTLDVGTFSCNDKLTLVTVVKNEESYILEWVEHHLSIGVSDIIIYDDSSADKAHLLRAELAKYIADESVELRDATQWDGREFLLSGDLSVAEHRPRSRLVRELRRLLFHSKQQRAVLHAWRDAVAKAWHTKEPRWLGLLDVDEFYVMSGQMPLSALLRDARRRGAHNIHIGLKAFGPGGHVRRPRDGVRESYLWRKARAD
mmetsp:Transcript_54299/g.118407  ORF Transcript_54299/g.118407 Transcript_54299/m.118407 type:complete len:405 (+) Transcript_54299:16-1230(+)